MADPRCQPLLQVLDDIEAELRRIGVWSGQPPAHSAFASSVPFFADSMRFEQWLQWVLLARLRALIEGDLPLPERCQVVPMAEESLHHLEQDLSRLFALLQALDNLFIATAAP
jgi:uncharacterized protein YqcC (DUF446 family)